MNKFVTVLGVAAVATFAGCKDPNYKPMGSQSQNEVKSATATTVEPVESTTNCTCADKKPALPCTCGEANCKCGAAATEAKLIDVKPAETKPVETKPAEPEYTIYIVQKGDYLAKISKKYNLKIDAIKELNGLKGDKIRLGQKLKLPGKIEVGEQTVPEEAKAKPVKKTYVPYTGDTVEYTVKNGDTLGAIAYGNGINIRQLKELNGLSSDMLKIGQKLKIPANGKSVAPAKSKTDEKPAPAKEVVKPTPVEEEPIPAVPEVKPVEPAEETSVAELQEPMTDAVSPVADLTYVVQEGEDLMAISIASGVSLSTLRELNNLPEDAKLTAGQVLKLPAEE